MLHKDDVLTPRCQRQRGVDLYILSQNNSTEFWQKYEIAFMNVYWDQDTQFNEKRSQKISLDCTFRTKLRLTHVPGASTANSWWLEANNLVAWIGLSLLCLAGISLLLQSSKFERYTNLNNQSIVRGILLLQIKEQTLTRKLGNF